MSTEEKKGFEDNFKLLKSIAEKIGGDELSVDEVINKGREAATAARNCLEILKKERGSFKKLEEELAALANEMESFAEEEEA